VIEKLIKIFFLTIICTALASCGTDTRSLIEGTMTDTIKNQAFNSSKSNNNDSGNEASDNKSKGSKSKYSGGSTGDDHYIDSDVMFVSKEPFKGSGWIYVQTAKVVTPPSSKTKNEGLYMIISNGEEIWTKYFWKTRIASEKELKIGLVVIAFERGDDGVYYSPEDKSQALSYNWFMAKITDLSDKHKGYVTVSGGYKINLENMRVAAK